MVETRLAPWSRCKAMILNGRADCMPAAYLTPGDDRWSYPERPIDVDETAVVFMPNQVKKWRGLSTLRGKKVVWPRGYNFQNYLALEVHWTEIDQAEQGWAMVERGRADFYMDILPEIEKYAKENEAEVSNFEIKKAFDMKTYVRFGTGPRTAELVALYDSGLKRLLESGELESLFRKWTGKFPEAAFRLP